MKAALDDDGKDPADVCDEVVGRTLLPIFVALLLLAIVTWDFRVADLVNAVVVCKVGFTGLPLLVTADLFSVSLGVAALEDFPWL